MRSRAAALAEQNRLLGLLPDVRARLQHIPVISNVGVGAKEVSGQMTDDFAFRVYVSVKLPRGDVPAQWRIPAQIRGVPTDVLQSTATEVLEDSRKLRPLRGGIQVRNAGDLQDPGGALGTIGCLVKFINTLEVMALTCEHVTLSGQTSVGVTMGQPKYSISCCCCTYNVIGKVFQAVKNAQLDCAILRLDDDIRQEVEAIDGGFNQIEGIGALTGAAQA